jgi:hypothetical protein
VQDDDSSPMPLDRRAPVAQLTVRDMQRAFKGALEEIIDDEERTAKFWRAGYEQFTKHATDDGAKWLWRRVVSALGGALMAAGLWLGFKFGGWGK